MCTRDNSNIFSPVYSYLWKKKDVFLDIDTTITPKQRLSKKTALSGSSKPRREAPRPTQMTPLELDFSTVHIHDDDEDANDATEETKGERVSYFEEWYSIFELIYL